MKHKNAARRAAVKDAYEATSSVALPSISGGFKSARMQHLVAMLRHLHERAGGAFSMTYGDVASTFGVQTSHAFDWMERMVAKGVVERVERGKWAKGGRFAAAWRYIAPVE